MLGCSSIFLFNFFYMYFASRPRPALTAVVCFSADISDGIPHRLSCRRLTEVLCRSPAAWTLPGQTRGCWSRWSGCSPKTHVFFVKFSSKVKSTVVPDIDSSICHSYGENLKNDFLSRQALKEIQSCVYGILGRPADKEEDDADADVGEDDAHPDLHWERVHERENTGANLWSLFFCYLTQAEDRLKL